jgi:glycosyltransferase involved in cell wall biosynthesis
MSLASVKHACYRGSRATTAATAAMLATHRTLGTYRSRVDAYIALSEFGRERFVEGGLPAERIVVKPNFLETDPGAGEGYGNYALFVGRLTPDKGVETLLQAWPLLRGVLPLKIVGDGPLAEQVKSVVASNPGIEWLGRQAGDRVAALMKDAACLIFPSRWYEGHPKTIVEALACGTPVIASNLGAIPESLPDGHDLFFEAGNPFMLAATVARFLDRNEQQWYRASARQTFLDRYTADANYRQLMAAYRAAFAMRDQRTHSGTRRPEAAGASTTVRS